MKHLVVIAIALAGCFGGGPQPTDATGVTTLFDVSVPPQDACTDSIYIGSVAIGSDHGYAITLPYIPSGPGFNCCPNGQQCPQPDYSLTAVYQFDNMASAPGGSKLAPLTLPPSGMQLF